MKPYARIVPGPNQLRFSDEVVVTVHKLRVIHYYPEGLRIIGANIVYGWCKGWNFHWIGVSLDSRELISFACSKRTLRIPL